MKLALFSLGILVVSVSCSTSRNSLFSAPPVAIEHQECTRNSECILIQRDCDDCDCGTPVNKNYVLQYEKEKKNRCADFQGPVCDLLCPSTVSICLNGKCVEE